MSGHGHSHDSGPLAIGDTAKKIVIGLLIAMGLTWWDDLRGAYFDGLATRCRTGSW